MDITTSFWTRDSTRDNLALDMISKYAKKKKKKVLQSIVILTRQMDITTSFWTRDSTRDNLA